jgi:murein DD-endopeptidase MepM/ murein hydrolase activator NlpD
MHRLLIAVTAFLLVLAAPAEAAWQWPVTGDVITPYRNGSDPYAAGQHRGIDIAAPAGTSVVAAAGGEVRFAGTAGSSGVTVSIRTGEGYDTSYLHLSSLAVRAGARVTAGDRIGTVGTTGTRSAAQPHLHDPRIAEDVVHGPTLRQQALDARDLLVHVAPRRGPLFPGREIGRTHGRSPLR